MLTFLSQYWPWLLLAFVVLDLWLVIYVWRQHARRRLSARDRSYLQAQWQRVEEELTRHPRQAVVEADKLVDTALKRLGYQGTLGEKLKKVSARFSDPRGLWRAHILRNRLAHELEVKLSQPEAAQALRAFKRALQDLGL